MRAGPHEGESDEQRRAAGDEKPGPGDVSTSRPKRSGKRPPGRSHQLSAHKPSFAADSSSPAASKSAPTRSGRREAQASGVRATTTTDVRSAQSPMIQLADVSGRKVRGGIPT
jgi:hypothetical protein